MTAGQRMRRRLMAFKVAGLYALAGVLWILFSDRVLLQVIEGDVAELARLQTFKGWFFIAVTASLLYLLVRNAISEEARIQYALRASERSFRAVFDGVSEPIFLHDPDTGATVDVNASAVNMYGYEREQLRTMRVEELSAEIEAYAQEKALARIRRARDGEEQVFEWQGRHRDGHVFWVEVHMRRAPIDDRILILATVHGIDDRKRMELALRRNEDNLVNAQRVARMGSWYLDVRKNNLEWSDETCRIFGVPSNTSLSLEGFFEVVHPDDRTSVMRAWEEALGGEVYDLEHRIIVDGETKWVRDRAEIYLGEDGTPLEALGTVQDVTERHLQEDMERQWHKQLETVANASPVLFWTSGLDKGCDWFNRPWLEFTGRTMEQELGTGWVEGVHPDDVDNCVTSYERAFDARKSFSLEYRLRRADGEYRWLLDRGMPRHDADGVFIGYIGSCLDITREKQTQEALQVLNAELEKRVEDRTSELEAVNKELRAFSYSVSHDLKAPLRGIDGYSQILLEDYAKQIDPEGQQFIANIRRGVMQMHELIEDMLAYSRMERRAVETSVVDLRALVETVVRVRGQCDPYAAVSIELDVPEIEVDADREGLALVLRNLLENAVKFSHTKKGASVHIGASRESDTLLIWVRDDGIGFDMKYHAKIFEIFQRLHRAEDYPGTGIGLALVSKAVHRMGGRVWAESEPGHGATFFLELPQ